LRSSVRLAAVTARSAHRTRRRFLAQRGNAPPPCIMSPRRRSTVLAPCLCDMACAAQRLHVTDVITAAALQRYHMVTLQPAGQAALTASITVAPENRKAHSRPPRTRHAHRYHNRAPASAAGRRGGIIITAAALPSPPFSVSYRHHSIAAFPAALAFQPCQAHGDNCRLQRIDSRCMRALVQGRISRAVKS